MRVVMDTGVIVSGLIRRNSIPGEIVNAIRDGRVSLIYSTPIIMEIIEVLNRPPFREKYHIQPDDITTLVNLIRMRGELVTITKKVAVCRDPKDDKFLEAALAGNAEAIISGDNDLTTLHLFEGIQILRPSEFLDKLK